MYLVASSTKWSNTDCSSALNNTSVGGWGVETRCRGCTASICE